MKSDLQMVEAEYTGLDSTVGYTPTSQGIKMGKRHASLDVLVPPAHVSGKQTGHQAPIATNLIASQGTLLHLAQSDMAVRSSRLPETQSYSQINMMNKVGGAGGPGGVGTLVNHRASTNSSEDYSASG